MSSSCIKELKTISLFSVRPLIVCSFVRVVVFFCLYCKNKKESNKIFRYYGKGSITNDNYIQFIRHDTLGFEYIEQSQNFVAQVKKIQS